jgi:hypothetical protein
VTEPVTRPWSPGYAGYLCASCLPEDSEVLTIYNALPQTCEVCGGEFPADQVHYVYRETIDAATEEYDA